MKVDVNLSMNYLIEVCKIKGSLEVEFVSDMVSKEMVLPKLLNSLKEKGFSGSLVFDGNTEKI